MRPRRASSSSSSLLNVNSSLRQPLSSSRTHLPLASSSNLISALVSVTSFTSTITWRLNQSMPSSLASRRIFPATSAFWNEASSPRSSMRVPSGNALRNGTNVSANFFESFNVQRCALYSHLKPASSSVGIKPPSAERSIRRRTFLGGSKLDFDSSAGIQPLSFSRSTNSPSSDAPITST